MGELGSPNQDRFKVAILFAYTKDFRKFLDSFNLPKNYPFTCSVENTIKVAAASEAVVTENYFCFDRDNEITKKIVKWVGSSFCNNFDGKLVAFHQFNEATREYVNFIYEKDGSIHEYKYHDEVFYKAFNHVFGEFTHKYVKTENNQKYYPDYHVNVFRVGKKYYYYDFTEQDLDLARFLHKEKACNFDNFLLRFEKDLLFLQKAIGYYKPIWDNPNANWNAFELDHEYVFCDTFA